MNKYNLLLGVCLIHSSTYSGFLDLAKLGQVQYQDIIINGKLVKKGVRDCATRFEVLEQIIKQYKRPVKILDIGASQGYFSFLSAYKYQATCVMIEGNYSHCKNVADQLEDLCKLNNQLNSIIFLKKHISEDDLEYLSQTEHFDIVLGFSVLHHFKDWKRATNAVLSLGDNVIIETPPANGSTAKKNPSIAPLEEYLLQNKGTLLKEVPRQNPKFKAKMLLFSNKNKFLNTFYGLETEEGRFQVISNFNEKYIYDHKEQTKIELSNSIGLKIYDFFGGIFYSNATLLK